MKNAFHHIESTKYENIKFVSIVDVSAFVDQLTIEALRRVENNAEPPCEAVRILFFTNK